jgi:hypothetical protein
MGSIDCITTVIGVLYFGAVELNPVLAGVAISHCFVIKLSATFALAEHVLAKKS